MTCLKRTNGLFTIGKRLIERLEMTYLALVNDLFSNPKWLVYQSSRLLPVGFRTVASTSYIPMTVPTRSSVNMLLLATHTSIIPSFWKETRDTARSSSYPLMTTRDGQTGCRTLAMPPTRSTLQAFKASPRRTTCRSMTRWSGRSELQQGQARKKTAG